MKNYFALTSPDGTYTYAFQIHAGQSLVSKIRNSTRKPEAYALLDLKAARRCWAALVTLKGYRKGTA